MSLKNRVGNFLLLFGLIALLVFGASVLTPPGNYDVWAFLAGAALLFVGLRFRLEKSKGGPPPGAGGPPAMPRPAPKAAAKGPAKGPPPGPPPKPKKQGPLATIMKGPANQKTAPKGGGGGGGGKPGGGKPRK